MTAIIYDERADHIDTMAKQGKEIERLKAEIERLKHDVGNLGYKIKNQRHEINNRLKEIEKLKDLLKECFEYIDWTDGAGSPINQQELLDKIDEVLK